ncbi:MAG: hypothetical protein KDA83_18810 [Planctomycetales bacterium]|nr:hypothetical protein [Planctomycetales bacterium]
MKSQACPFAPFGSIYYWAGSKRLGELEDPVFLAGHTANLSRLLAHRKSQSILWIQPGDETSVLADAYEAFFGDGCVGDANRHQLLCRSIITAGAPPFSGLLLMVANSRGDERVLWMSLKDRAMGSASLDFGEFDLVVQEFLDWIEDALAPRDVDKLRDIAMPDRRKRYWYSPCTDKPDYCVFRRSSNDKLVFSHLVPDDNVGNVVPRTIREHFDGKEKLSE